MFNQASNHDDMWECVGVAPRILTLAQKLLNGLLHPPAAFPPESLVRMLLDPTARLDAVPAGNR